MVAKNPMDAVNKPARKKRNTGEKSVSTYPRKKYTRVASGKKKSTLKSKKTFSLWTKFSHRMLWVLTILIAVGYLWFVYNHHLKPYFYRWDFGDTYDGHPVVHGIDISHHQGEIDWHKLAKAEHEGSGIHFVFMKATEGSDWIDSTFQYNFEKAREVGFIRGAYHFFSNTSPAEKQASFFCEQVNLTDCDLPPVLDVETKGNYGDDSLRLEVKNWLRKVEAHYGMKPIIYTSRKFKEKYLDDDTLNTYPFWIANYYVDSLTYTGEWAFWQHTDHGRLPGIKGRVDMNVFNGSLTQLKGLTLRVSDSLMNIKMEVDSLRSRKVSE